ncbi:hypothetical protein [Xanthomonas vasicola]|uniref:hypothetical protein n=1 Tax=Xanthomonas vasicola TaxID=56459 RepID=UPI000346ACED|nr:hypothetical protein [Xanthomonas vasicola]MBV7306984.1 hypothetical protein [Xanthomonas vasicola pv. vasculorum]MDO6936517.1 hypothetical protein [Xanthomonas vasicola]MDO6940477.1 hypothetical protein [Xanthomonas vasicola]
MKAEALKKLLPPARAEYSDEDLRSFSVDELYRRKLTPDETRRLREINEERRREIERKAAEWAELERPLVVELQSAGFDVESVWDLFNRKQPWDKSEQIRSYVEVLPILLDHLGRDYPSAVREGIARAMAMPEARFAWDDFVRFYRSEEHGRAKDGLAVALAAAADSSVLDELISLAKDRSQGSSRILLLSAFARFTNARARAILMELGTDSELQEEAQIILKKLKAKQMKAKKRDD